MNILIVDDEHHARKMLEQAVSSALPDAALCICGNADEAMAATQGQPFDLAFLDIEMPGNDGLTLAEALSVSNPRMNIVFVTGHDHYARKAFGLHASGYLMKPVSAEDIRSELENLRHIPAAPLKEIQIRTFGNFEIYKCGEPVVFSRSKAKEILAYLVDRSGAGVTKRELASVLWEEGLYTRSRQQQLQTFIATLLTDLRKAEVDCIVRRPNYLAIDIDKVDCDLYRYLAGDAVAANAYTGEYMTNYSWGEFTLARLDQRRPANAD